MNDRGPFLAYPAIPKEVGQTLSEMKRILENTLGISGYTAWEESDVAGHFIRTEVLDHIDSSSLFVADITRLNFNVSYEIGHAIGRKKPIILLRNASLKKDDDVMRAIGIFDTIGYHEYTNSQDLSGYLASLESQTLSALIVSDQSPIIPLYIISPKYKTDSEIRLFSRIKKTRYKFRTYDPEEQGRLSADEAISGVMQAIGVVVPLLSNNHEDALVHNIRAAFVSGLANGLNKPLLLMQAGNFPVPIDYRDIVSSYQSMDQIDTMVANFLPLINERYHQIDNSIAFPTRETSPISNLSLGASAAENESSRLDEYFVITDDFRRIKNGDAQVVAGRKGAGKTALFLMIRNDIKRNNNTVVLDLRPEGYQLLRFKEVVLDLLAVGSKDHTITAFWEYLILLEICHKLLSMDKSRMIYDHTIAKLYKSLEEIYSSDEYVTEGDFAERLSRLSSSIQDEFKKMNIRGESIGGFGTGEITNILYRHDVSDLQRNVFTYLKHKDGVWILIDNLDKGWPPRGISDDDVRILRCLLDALQKLARRAQNLDIACKTCVFVRNDVYERLVDSSPDRGKIARLIIDWSDPDLLRRMLRDRLAHGNRFSGDQSFESIWRSICVSHIGVEESSQYLIDRSLMRPRFLIDLLQSCLSRAISVRHSRIEHDDILRGEHSYSSGLVDNICLEIRDIHPEMIDILYVLIGQSPYIAKSKIDNLLLEHGLSSESISAAIEIMLWFGILGVERVVDDVAYIYTVNYDIKRLRALSRYNTNQSAMFYINPAVWSGLEIIQK